MPAEDLASALKATPMPVRGHFESIEKSDANAQPAGLQHAPEGSAMRTPVTMPRTVLR
jgi:hypothetical protein